jgi:hypothetical protein
MRYLVPGVALVGVIAAGACSAPDVTTNTTTLAAATGTVQARPASALSQSVAGVCGDSSGYDNPGVVSQDANLAGWLLFLAVNCPAHTGQAHPVVWETWKPNYGVYLPGGAPPMAWGSPLPARVLTDQPQIDGYSLVDKNGQPVLSEIRMNRATFDYIVERKLYSKAAQIGFFQNSNSAPIAFPMTAMEIKAAWLILTPGDPANSRYYTVSASYVDPAGRSHAVLAGLAGLHVTSKVLPQWFWTTFEQVDNQARTAAPLTEPIPPNVRAMNDDIHAALPADSVWRFYNLRGVQMAMANAGAPTLLSNTLIETNFQTSSSCMTCHGLSTRGAASQGVLGFFQAGAGGVQGFVGPIGAPANKYVDAFGKPVCYDGSRSLFTNCAASSPAVVYRTLDFVWSLREAK